MSEVVYDHLEVFTWPQISEVVVYVQHLNAAATLCVCDFSESVEMFLFFFAESHQEDHAEGCRGGEDRDGGSCDHLYHFTPFYLITELINVPYRKCFCVKLNLFL